MKVETILVPTDFSELSNEAVEYAFSMAKRLGAKMVFLHTLQRPDQTDPMTPLYDEGYAYVKDHANGLLNDLVQKAKSQGQEAAAELVDGIPFVEIIRMARKKDADLIIMGTHGRTGMAHLMIGSQAERVVRQSSCPVLTIKSPRHTFTPV